MIFWMGLGSARSWRSLTSYSCFARASSRISSAGCWRRWFSSMWCSIPGASATSRTSSLAPPQRAWHVCSMASTAWRNNWKIPCIIRPKALTSPEHSGVTSGTWNAMRTWESSRLTGSGTTQSLESKQHRNFTTIWKASFHERQESRYIPTEKPPATVRRCNRTKLKQIWSRTLKLQQKTHVIYCDMILWCKSTMDRIKQKSNRQKRSKKKRREGHGWAMVPFHSVAHSVAHFPKFQSGQLDRCNLPKCGQRKAWWSHGRWSNIQFLGAVGMPRLDPHWYPLVSIGIHWYPLVACEILTLLPEFGHDLGVMEHITRATGRSCEPLIWRCLAHGNWEHHGTPVFLVGPVASIRDSQVPLNHWLRLLEDPKLPKECVDTKIYRPPHNLQVRIGRSGFEQLAIRIL